MRSRLLWKLLLINLPVIGIVIAVVWLATEHFAADYFMVLMDRYMVSPTETHRAFLTAIHRTLLWSSLAALLLAFLLSALLTRGILRPLDGIGAASRRIAAGDFRARIDVTSGDAFGEVTIAFNRMADSLERLEKLRRRMVADVAHELRTPLTNLRGYLEGLGDGVVPHDPATFRMLEREVLRLVKLVEDLGQLARAEAARAYLAREPVDLSGAVAQLLALDRRNFEDKGLRVETRFPPGARRVAADRGKLLQVLRNLLENAWKYTPAGGSVTIASEREGEGVRVTFVNSGPPIPAGDLPFLFERFYRPERSRSREDGGAGIGLAVVREIVEAHGGRVGAGSDEAGVRVWFLLEAAPEVPEGGVEKNVRPGC